MEISCPSCQNRFEAVTRRAVCTSCGTQLDVWALVSGHANPPPPPKPPPVHKGEPGHHGGRDPYATNLSAEASESVLDLPLAEIAPERSAEEDPVLEPAFSALPKEFAEIASPVPPATKAPDRDDASPYRTNVGTPETEPSRGGIAKWLIALVALAAVALMGTYFLKKTGGELATVVTPTIAPEPGPTSSIEASTAPSTSASPLPSPSPTSDARTTQVSPSPAPTTATPPVKAAESADAQTRARAVNPQPSTNAKYTLQITAKASEAEARLVAQKIIDAGLDAKIIKATVDDGKTWYRVRVGAFATRDEAKQYGDQLKRGGRIESYFVTDLR